MFKVKVWSLIVSVMLVAVLLSLIPSWLAIRTNDAGLPLLVACALGAAAQTALGAGFNLAMGRLKRRHTTVQAVPARPRARTVRR